MSIRELTKIANKLDSLGLTKEADVLDSYIRKSAIWVTDLEATPQGALKAPPPALGVLMEKWLDTFTIGGRFYNKDMAIEKFINTSDPRAASVADMEVRSICQYIEKEIAADNGHSFNLWYYDNIENTGARSQIDKLVSNDLKELEDTFREVVKDRSTRPEVSAIYQNTIMALSSAGLAWRMRKSWQEFEKSKMEGAKKPSSPEAPTSKPLMTMQEGTVYDKTKATTSNPWAGTSGEIKKMWTQRATVKKKDPSFSNYQAWLRAKNLAGVSEQGILAQLRNEIMGGDIKKDYTLTEAKPEAISPGFGIPAVEKQRTSR